MEAVPRRISDTDLLGGGVLALAVLAAYHNSLSAPFVFDDTFSITANPTIRHLWPFWAVLSPPAGGLTVSGRPVLNLSLALNYALSGTVAWSYHAVNVIIHALAGLTLFGVVRRTLRGAWRRKTDEGNGASSPDIPVFPSPRDDATLLALAIAGIWALHPLQTESVTYVVQRAESLMGLCYLLTLYCFIRGTEGSGGAAGDRVRPPTAAGSDHDAPAAARRRRQFSARSWHALAVIACLLGMATKEVMVSAPLLVLLYDRTFVAGSFREAWRRHRWLHAGLGATWLLLGWLVLGTGGNRGGSLGWGLNGSWWTYGVTQFEAIGRYLSLSVWPHALTFDYGERRVESAADVVPAALLVAVLVAGTLVGLRRRSCTGFAGAWFLAILAPTSLLPGTTQMIVEHRMYLALAAVVALVVPGVYALAGRRSFVALVLVAAGLGWLTERRNQDYRSELALWSDSVRKCPRSAIALNNLGKALMDGNRVKEAIEQFRAALQLNLGYAETYYNLGAALLQTGRRPEAIVQLQTAIRLKPGYAEAHDSLGSALILSGRADEAIREYEEAIRLKPDFASVHYNLACAELHWERWPEAIREFEASLRLNPDNARAHQNLANAFLRVGRQAEAIEQYQAALRLQPDDTSAREMLRQLRAAPSTVRPSQ